MMKHVVMWRLREDLAPAREETAQLLKRKLEGLVGVIPELERLEVGIHKDPSDVSADVVLWSEFADTDAMKRYQEHPAHQEVVAFLKDVVRERRVVDFIA